MVYRLGLMRLETKRVEALFSGNATRYTELCGDLGITDIEDLFLCDRAMADIIIEKARGYNGYFKRKNSRDKPKRDKRYRRPKEPVDYGNDLKSLENIARVALKSFLPLEMGERLYIGKLKDRLSEILHAGYPVVTKGFRKMQRG